MVFRIFFLEFYIIIFLKKPNPEGFSQSLQFAIVRDERESFHRKTIQKKLQIQIIGEVNIILYLYLNLLRFHLGYLLKYLDNGIVFMDMESFFIHIGRLCSGVYGLWGLSLGGAFLLWLSLD